MGYMVRSVIPVPILKASGSSSVDVACAMFSCTIPLNGMAIYSLSVTVSTGNAQLTRKPDKSGKEKAASGTLTADGAAMSASDFKKLKKSLRAVQLGESMANLGGFSSFSVVAKSDITPQFTYVYLDSAYVLNAGCLMSAGGKSTYNMVIDMAPGYMSLNNTLHGAFFNVAPELLLREGGNRAGISGLLRKLDEQQTAYGNAIEMKTRFKSSAVDMCAAVDATLEDRLLLTLGAITHFLTIGGKAGQPPFNAEECYAYAKATYGKYISAPIRLRYNENLTEQDKADYSIEYSYSLFNLIYGRVRDSGEPLLTAMVETLASDMLLNTVPVSMDCEPSGGVLCKTRSVLDIRIPESYTKAALDRLQRLTVEDAFSLEDSTDITRSKSFPDVFIVCFGAPASFSDRVGKDSRDAKTEHFGVYCHDSKLDSLLRSTGSGVLDAIQRHKGGKGLNVKFVRPPEWLQSFIGLKLSSGKSADEQATILERYCTLLDDIAKALYIRMFRNACSVSASVKADAYCQTGKYAAYGVKANPYEGHLGDMYRLPQPDGSFSIGRLRQVSYNYSSGDLSGAHLELKFDQAITDIEGEDELKGIFALDCNPIYEYSKTEK